MTKHVEQLEDPPERVGREELGSVKSSLVYSRLVSQENLQQIP